MLTKPFISPLVRKPEKVSIEDDIGRQNKRRRISSDNDSIAQQPESRVVFKAPGISALPRKPLLAVHNLAVEKDVRVTKEVGVQSCYNILWLFSHGNE